MLAVEAQNLVKRYDETVAVAGIDLEVAALGDVEDFGEPLDRLAIPSLAFGREPLTRRA